MSKRDDQLALVADRLACLLTDLHDMAYAARCEGKDDGGVLWLVGLAVGQGEDFDRRRHEIRRSDHFDRALESIRRLIKANGS